MTVTRRERKRGQILTDKAKIHTVKEVQLPIRLLNDKVGMKSARIFRFRKQVVLDDDNIP